MGKFIFHISILISILFNAQLNFAQEFTVVEHPEGTEIIGGIEVTVTAVGCTSYYETTLCEGHLPYFIGYDDQGNSTTGSFVFNFEPAISMAKFTIGRISFSSNNHEIIEVWVNGEHYKIQKEGEPNSCHGSAFINKDGNLDVKKDVDLGGFANIEIEGPIKTLEIKNVVLSGTPNGSLFSLYISADAISAAEVLKLRKKKEAGLE
mgnify:CR=1 FL=1